MEATNVPLIEWGIATQAAAGYDESGDNYLVESFTDGTLVAVVDGLGHGPQAANAAETAITALRGRTHEPIATLVKRCHEASRRTRGVVISLASFREDHTMSWLGIGNVNGILLHPPGAGSTSNRERLLPRGGVVGYQLPTPRPVTISVRPGDTLVFATDGLRSALVEDIDLDQEPQQMADDALARYGRGTDDALVLVARYVGR